MCIRDRANCNQWTEEAFVGRRLLDECRARDADTGAGRAGVPPMVPPGAVRSSFAWSNGRVAVTTSRHSAVPQTHSYQTTVATHPWWAIDTVGVRSPHRLAVPVPAGRQEGHDERAPLGALSGSASGGAGYGVPCTVPLSVPGSHSDILSSLSLTAESADSVLSVGQSVSSVILSLIHI